ncbi:MAG: hypothetical protein HY695_24475 [Deltaproteobacteria bacterium]|nr:hypothetical protein [Deltaproteobacteria bacterium]
MKRSKFITPILCQVTFLILIIGVATRPAEAQIYSCFPTCSETDGRFLSLVGSGLASLAGTTISIGLTAPSTATALQLGIFDGETSGLWDYGSAQVEYTLYADPLADGSGSVIAGQWLGNGVNPTSGSDWSADSATMPNNGWWTVTIDTSPAAQRSNGSYTYVLRVRMTDPAQVSWTNFKLRVLSPANVAISPQMVLAFSAPMFSLAEAQIIYPNWPSLTPTMNDGSWKFYFDAPVPQSAVTVWDGDFDYGSYDCTTMDTDDPDTPNAPFRPSWATGTAAVPEGVAVAVGFSGPGGCSWTGLPPDEGAYAVFQRPPSVKYELIDPNGFHYLNDNPSGTEEWEQFRVDTAPFNPALMDYQAESLPAGRYTVHVNGLDLANLAAFSFAYPALGEQCYRSFCDLPPPLVPSGAGTGTPGYWMNHPEAWPVSSIKLGGLTYTKDQAITTIKRPTKKDVTYAMAQALIAAKLNVRIGAEWDCIIPTIFAADVWLAEHLIGSGVTAGGASSPWRDGEPLHKLLDDYNNGRLCAPPRD